MEWPQFETAQPLADGRSWTATFTGVDQRCAVANYLLRITDGDRVTEMPVDIDLPPEDPRSETTRDILRSITIERPPIDVRSQLERVAQLSGPALPYDLELAAFRRSYTTPIEAIRACERPDWAFEIALAETPDRKAVIAEAAHVAQLLSKWDPTSVLGAARIRHPPLVVVEAWAGDLEYEVGRLSDRGERLAMLGALAIYVAASPFLYAWIPGWLLGAIMPPFLIGAAKVLGPACTRLLARELRHQVAQLDEPKALAIVFGELDRGWKRALKKHATRPEKVALLMRFFVRRSLARVLGDGVKRPEDSVRS